MIVLVINAIAILSEDRFLARIGWAAQQPEPTPSFGAAGGGGDVSIKGKIINLISATRLLTRSMFAPTPAPNSGVYLERKEKRGLCADGLLGGRSTVDWDKFYHYHIRATTRMNVGGGEMVWVASCSWKGGECETSP